MWAASLDGNHGDEDAPYNEEYATGRVEGYTDYSGDYRQYYRDLLEQAMESDDRFRKGQVYWVKLI